MFWYKNNYIVGHAFLKGLIQFLSALNANTNLLQHNAIRYMLIVNRTQILLQMKTFQIGLKQFIDKRF